MAEHAVAIGLKIPDNSAYTALVTLQRLGVDVQRVERNDIVHFAEGDPASLRTIVERDESLFNPNKHRVMVLQRILPRAGEVWIETLDGLTSVAGIKARRYVGWRLFAADGNPVPRETVGAAVEALLCNPAIERAHY